MQLLTNEEVVGIICRGCGQLKRLAAFPKCARRSGRSTWCSDCSKKQTQALNYAFSRNMVARRALVGGTLPLGDD